MTNIWFTSDTHFGHTNIISYCNRPFSSVEEMNEALIKNWNDRVGHDDIVFHLGDFSFERNAAGTAARLSGKKHLIRGNHDRDKTIAQIEPFFKTIRDVFLLKLGHHKFWLSHYAHRAWWHNYKGVIHLYGHSHGTLDDYGKSTDVGVDVWDYSPVHVDTIVKMMNGRENIPHKHNKVR